MRSRVARGVLHVARVVLPALLAACAAGSRAPSSPQSEAPSGGAYAQPAGSPPSSVGQPLPSTPPAPPPPAPEAPGPPPKQPGAGATPQPQPTPQQQRALAMQSAVNEVESSQRELDVAAGDCRNACRALGSMDRAAGRLCGLTQGDPETRRCDDAKQRVYSARDRVKATCGQCEGGPSVERSAPIPSLR